MVPSGSFADSHDGALGLGAFPAGSGAAVALYVGHFCSADTVLYHA